MIDAKKFLRRANGNDAARFEKDDARSEQQRFAEIVSDKDNSFAEPARQGAEFALEFRTRDGIESAEGLVHQENRRIGSESAGNPNALALAAGEFAGAAIGKFGWVQSNQAHQLANTNGSAAAVPFLKCGNERHIFGNRKMRKKSGVLNDISDAAAQFDGVPLCGWAILDENLAFGWQ